jgi:hypothetical protein
MLRRFDDHLVNMPPLPPSLRPFYDQLLASGLRYYEPDIKPLAATIALLGSAGESRRKLVMEACGYLLLLQQKVRIRNSFSSEDKDLLIEAGVRKLLSMLIRVKVPYKDEDVVQLLHFASEQTAWNAASRAGLIGATERHVQETGLRPAVAEAIESLISVIGTETVEAQKLVARLTALINRDSKEAVHIPLTFDEPWTQAVESDLKVLDAGEARAWRDLMHTARTVSGTKPSKKYLVAARAGVQTIGVERFKTSLQVWAEIAGTKANNATYEGREFRLGLDAVNADVLRGLIWAAASLDDPTMCPMLSSLAERCYQKLPNVGPRCAKVANACVTALSAMGGQTPLTHLSMLAGRVKQPSGRKMIQKTLEQVASKHGLTVAGLQERCMPDFGLVSGTSIRTFGDEIQAVLKVDRDGATISWRKGGGKPQKSVPPVVKESFAAQFKDLKAELKTIDKAVAAERTRLERLFLRQTPWRLSEWKTYYRDQPFVSILANLLIWQFAMPSGEVSAMWNGQAFVDSNGATHLFDDTSTLVTLWHPATTSADDITAWRRFLIEHQIRQPFKQAHREVYLLTEAERRTQTYSNRFAANIVRQHQLVALCTQRGWSSRLMGGFDSDNTPSLTLAEWDLVAEFYLEASGAEELSASGIFVHVSTDQVRFSRPATRVAIPLDQIPPLVFSEAMRDVDLFVGVASVGNDPAWQDGGPEGRYQAYWQSYSFGDLSETARTRKAVLEALLPRLTKLKDRWRLDEKFLVVRGQIRTYKIHLGSGNILMEPNDQYLCIVPDRSTKAGEQVFLPFEGDSTLSIILSKAFLLAEDDKIKDPTITRQIK